MQKLRHKRSGNLFLRDALLKARGHKVSPCRTLYFSRFAACVLSALLITHTAIAEPQQSHDAIQKTVEAFLKKQLEGHDSGDFEIHVSRLDPRLSLVSCETPLAASMAPGAKLSGKTTVAVQCNSPKPWKVFVPANLVVYENVLAAARTIVRGEMLNADDLTLVKKQMRSTTQGYFRSVEQAVGFVAKRSIAGGRVLTAQMVQAPRLVQRGQEVILLATTPLLEVRMKGKALADGGKGDVIQVRNVSTNRVVEGVVSGVGVVKVNM